MSGSLSPTPNLELAPLLSLSARIGSDPPLTQGSTGNTSIKLRGCIWIKASGKWLADALYENILIPLDLAEVRDCVNRNIDPADRYAGASVETAMHAVFPHRVVVHVHCVNTVAWAVRLHAPDELESQLRGLRWQWIPYVASGLALANRIEQALLTLPETDVLILGNHGLVIGGQDVPAAEHLLTEVHRRLSVPPRQAPLPDYSVLASLADRFGWEVPDDDDVHALGTDAISRNILAGGILYPCQAIFSNCSAPAASFRAVPHSDCREQMEDWPFLIIEGRGVIVNSTITPAARAMICGLAQVVQRIGAGTPIRYLTKAETLPLPGVMGRYRELSSVGRSAV